MSSKQVVAGAILASAGLAVAAPEYRPLPAGVTGPGRFHVRLTTANLSAASLELVKAVNGTIYPDLLAIDVGGFTVADQQAANARVGKLMQIAEAIYVQQDAFLPSYQAVVPGTPFNDTFVRPVFPKDYDNTKGNWGLQKLAGLPLDFSKKYEPLDATSVDVYVFDSGINVDNPQFEGRASNFHSCTGNFADLSTTGTMVAGILGSKDYGVARTNIKSVKVTDCWPGDTQYARSTGMSVTAGAQGVITEVKKTGRPSVAVLPWAATSVGSYSNAARFLAQNGVFVVAAAGRVNSNACTMAPATAKATPGVEILTVNPSFPNDWTAFTSTGALMGGFGPCVHTLAPGLNIKTFGPDGKTAYLTGTQAALAHTAGVAAAIMHKYPKASHSQIKQAILTSARKVHTWFDGEDVNLTPESVVAVPKFPTLCKSTNPTLDHSFCQASNCDATYVDAGLCELNGKDSTLKVCVSIVANIPDSWCANVNCEAAYSGLCTWKCAA